MNFYKEKKKKNKGNFSFGSRLPGSLSKFLATTINDKLTFEQYVNARYDETHESLGVVWRLRLFDVDGTFMRTFGLDFSISDIKTYSVVWSHVCSLLWVIQYCIWNFYN